MSIIEASSIIKKSVSIILTSTFIIFSKLLSSTFVISKSLCRVLAGFLVVSVILFTALPVGAAKIYFLSSSSSRSIIHFIIVVFPVPGPPVIILILEFRHICIASFCSLDSTSEFFSDTFSISFAKSFECIFCFTISEM